MSVDFIDTNVVVYLFSVDEEVKRVKSEELVAKGSLVISTQVLNEFSNVMLRKFSLPVQDVGLACRELIDAFKVSTVTSARNKYPSEQL